MREPDTARRLPSTLRTDPRCLALLEEQRKILELVNQAKMPLPHWEDADGPTEDMFIHNQDFKGLSWDSFLPTLALRANGCSTRPT